MFKGGEFELKYKNEIKTIPFETNTMIIFPSNTEHRVLPIHLDENTIENYRYSVQIWAR